MYTYVPQSHTVGCLCIDAGKEKNAEWNTVLSRNSGSRNSGFSHNSGQNCDDGIFIK